MTNRAAPARPQLQSCPHCGGYNPRGFAICGGCGARLASCKPDAAPAPAEALGSPAGTKKHAAPRNAPFSTAPMWPLWATSDDQRLGCALADLPGFSAGRGLVSADRKTGLAVHESAHQICVFEVAKDPKRLGKDIIQRRIFGYEAMAEVQTIDGIFRRPLSKTFGSAEEIVAILLRLQQGETRHETLIGFTAKPQAPGSPNHRAALIRAREWQTYLVGLMHLPGLMAFGAGKSNGGIK